MDDTASIGIERRSGRLLMPFSSTATVVTVAVVTLISLVVINQFPTLDLAVSRIFFVDAPCQANQLLAKACGEFPARSVPILAGLRQILQVFPLLAAVGLGLYLIVRLVRGERFLSPGILAGSAVFWTYVVSVGLLVNVILKEHWGRPRPIQTIFFGGDFPFVPAGKIASYCASNCSFVSGESAAAFWLLCIVPLLPAGWRTVGFIGALAIGILTSVMRIAFGAHFLSDVVFSGLVVLLTFSLLAMLAARISEHGLRPFWRQPALIPAAVPSVPVTKS